MPAWTDRLPMPSAYFLLVLREFGTTPDVVAAILDGIERRLDDQSAEITLGDQIRQVRNVNRIEAPGWGLRIGRRFDAATHGPVGFAAVSAPTLADAIDVIARFGHVRSPYFRFSLRRTAERVVFRVDERLPLADDERIPLIESLTQSLQMLIESVLRKPMREAAFAFAWPAPAYADAYRDHYHGKVRFEAAHTEVALPAAWLRLACPLADPVTYRESLRTLETLERRLDGDDFLAARVEQLLAASHDGGPGFEEVARRLHVSGRTLNRRLARAGTTYQELLDAHRRDRAEALLAQPELGIAEISHQLGYEDPANFGRACRRWFNAAPGQHRRRLLDAGGTRGRERL